jgi:hypothetical protein
MASSQLGTEMAAMYRSMRRWPRLKIHVPVTVVVRKWDKTQFVQAWGKDLNEGGIAVFAGTELRIGQVVEISFTPPYQGLPLTARTAVRNRRGYIYGLEFLTETREDEKQVEAIRAVLKPMVIA